jgi:hypothetical protein
MTDTKDLDAQLAQRLFGWTLGLPGDWNDAEGLWHGAPPAYSTDPAATAQVWQWVEQQRLEDHRAWYVEYTYGLSDVVCTIIFTQRFVDACGATWPEALCRAALALAEVLEGEQG